MLDGLLNLIFKRFTELAYKASIKFQNVLAGPRCGCCGGFTIGFFDKLAKVQQTALELDLLLYLSDATQNAAMLIRDILNRSGAQTGSLKAMVN